MDDHFMVTITHDDLSGFKFMWTRTKWKWETIIITFMWIDFVANKTENIFSQKIYGIMGEKEGKWENLSSGVN